MKGRERMDPAAVEYLDYCAHIGDVTGKVSMGHLYHSGSHGVPRDTDAALHWYRSAARQGDGMGHANLGMMQLRRGHHHAAWRSFRRATKLRDLSGWAGIGYAYYYGAGVPQSDDLAAKAIALAAKQGHLDSIYNLGVLHLLGRGVTQNVRQAYRYLRIAAEYGHPQAQLHVGRLTRQGLGVMRDCQTGLFFLKHAAENAPLVRELMMVGLKAHEQQRPQRALIHYLLAAHMGVERAQQNAGFLYANAALPLRAKMDTLYKQRALQLFKLAAIDGSLDAQVQLGNLLVETRDPEYVAKGIELYKSAARSGSRDAHWHLGMSYLHGRGVERSLGAAIELFKAAGEQSKYERLRGVEAAVFGVVRFVHDARVPLLLGAALLSVIARGGNPAEMLQGLFGGGARPTEPAVYEEDEDMDDFDDES